MPDKQNAIYLQMSMLYKVRQAKEVKMLSKMLHLRTKYDQQVDIYQKTKSKIENIKEQLFELTRSLEITEKEINIEYINNINRRKFWLNYDHEKFSYYLEKEKDELNKAYKEYLENKKAYNLCKKKNEEIAKNVKKAKREINKNVEQKHDDELIDSHYSKRIGV